MEISVQELDGNIARIVLDGRLDLAGAAAIDLSFSTISGSRRALIVDMSRVSFIASMGMRTLVSGAKAVRGNGGKMVLLSPVALVERALKTASIDTLIPIFHDLAEAKAAVALDAAR
ncbi:MAG TPA: STAS domain-containing protein [Stellaceae bacterium]|jgi:anti-anti-sigma factor|nr:STAS domain-containing protein [Stellaceae bacterium]